jgi:hypothetical protein
VNPVPPPGSLPLPHGWEGLIRSPGAAEDWTLRVGKHRLTGSGSELREILLSDTPVIRDILRPAGPSSDVRLLPGRLEIDSGALRVLVAPDLEAALILLEVRASREEVRMELTVCGSAEPQEGGGFRWKNPGGAGQGAMRITPPPAWTDAFPTESGTRLRLTWRGPDIDLDPSAGRIAIVVASSTEPEDLDRTLRRGPSIPLRSHRVLAGALGNEAPILQASVDGASLDAALGWAASSLPPPDRSLRLDAVLARLALGSPPPPEAVPALAEEDPLTFLLTVSAISAWVGEPRSLSSALSLIPGVVDRIPADPVGASALLGAAAAAETAGEAVLASMLRLRAAGGDEPMLDSLQAAAVPPVAGVTLQPPVAPSNVEPTTGPPAPRAPVLHRLDVLAREILGPRPSDAALRELPSRLLFGLLGARGDASVGRLHLAPELPEDLRDLVVRNIPLGRSRVELRCLRAAGVTTFHFAQTAGSVPVNLVFEPILPMRPAEIRMDGTPVDLAAEQRKDGWRIQAQFPLDGTRELRISNE